MTSQPVVGSVPSRTANLRTSDRPRNEEGGMGKYCIDLFVYRPPTAEYTGSTTKEKERKINEPYASVDQSSRKRLQKTAPSVTQVDGNRVSSSPSPKKTNEPRSGFSGRRRLSVRDNKPSTASEEDSMTRRYEYIHMLSLLDSVQGVLTRTRSLGTDPAQ
jgi:hypothetical protein